MIAVRTGTPVLPIYIGATLRPFRRCPVYIGRPIDLRKEASLSLAQTDTVREATQRLRETMLALQREAEKQ